MEPITREYASTLGLKRFYTGVPCVHGHISERLVSNGVCIKCARIATKAWVKTPEYRSRPDVKAKRKAAREKWLSSRPEKKREYIDRYHARKKAAGSHSLVHICTTYTLQNGRCAGCCQLFSEEVQISVDHIEPLVRGGTNTHENLQLLCLPCNLDKGDRNNKEWAADPRSRLALLRPTALAGLPDLRFAPTLRDGVKIQLELFPLDTPPPPVS